VWIRSQNKLSLRNYNGVFIDSTRIGTICGDANNEESWYTIGEYSSDKRALEVLNNIQDVIFIRKNYYAMPKE